MNAYKVWAGDMGYMLILANSPTSAKLDYWTNFAAAWEMFEADADVHCQLIERDVEVATAGEYEKSRYYDLLFAGYIHPDWALDKMAWDWWYHEAGEYGYS